jgi:hypothetical protein
MSVYQWLATAVMALSPLLVAAQQDRTNNQPADPTVAQSSVPALTFQSSFKDYKGMAEETETPDSVWIAANREVAGESSHEDHEGHVTATVQPDNPGASQKPAVPASNPHAGHRTHGKGS